MKFKQFFYFGIIFFIVIFTGCSMSSNNANNTNQSAKNDKNAPNKERRMGMPDFGQPEEQPDLRGLVESIQGNEVSILKIERPRGSQGANGDRQWNGSSTSENHGNSNQAGQNRQGNQNNQGNMGIRIMPSSGQGQQRSGGGMFFMSGSRGTQDAEAQKQMLERIKQMSTGKEKVIIPVGIQMLKPDPANKGTEPKMLEAVLSDIKPDSMITVWLDKTISDKKVASFVLIMQ